MARLPRLSTAHSSAKADHRLARGGTVEEARAGACEREAADGGAWMPLSQSEELKLSRGSCELTAATGGGGGGAASDGEVTDGAAAASLRAADDT